MTTRKDAQVVDQNITLEMIQVQLEEHNVKLATKTIKRKLNEGAFGTHKWLGEDKVIIKSNAIITFVNNRSAKKTKRKKPKEPDKKRVLTQKFTLKEARILAKKRVDEEVDRRAKWTWDYTGEALKKRAAEMVEHYVQLMVGQYEVIEIDENQIKLNIIKFQELPYELLDYVSARFTPTAADFFLSQYIKYLDSLSIDLKEAPYCDMPIRGMVEEEIYSANIRQAIRSSAGVTNSDLQGLLDSSSRRWKGFFDSLANRGKMTTGQSPTGNNGNEKPETPKWLPSSDGGMK